MPRRNFQLLLIIALVCLACALRTSRYGKVLAFAMWQVSGRSLEKHDDQELFEGAMEGITAKLDEYSDYIGPKDLAAFNETLDRKFGGVGIEILLDRDTGQLTVVSPLVGTPAHRAGIRAGDKILRIDGKSTQGLSLDDARDRMRGDPGQPVTLTILHPDDDEPVDVEIIREEIKVDTVVGDTRDDDGTWDYMLDEYDGIAYVRINSFSGDTADEFRRVLGDLEDRGMRGMVLDLRDNPGGLLSAAVEVCDSLVPAGVIVSTQGRGGRPYRAFYATKQGTFSGFPVAVLINNYSASASEIVAACLQDHGRAAVVGERSFGKGTVQEIIDLEPGQGVLKLTTAGYHRPSGVNIHRGSDATEDDAWGVRPDEGYEVAVEGPELAKLHRWWLDRQTADGVAEPPAGEEAPPADYFDPQLAKALEYLEKQLGEKLPRKPERSAQ